MELAILNVLFVEVDLGGNTTGSRRESRSRSAEWVRDQCFAKWLVPRGLLIGGYGRKLKRVANRWVLLIVGGCLLAVGVQLRSREWFFNVFFWSNDVFFPAPPLCKSLFGTPWTRWPAAPQKTPPMAVPMLSKLFNCADVPLPLAQFLWPGCTFPTFFSLL